MKKLILISISLLFSFFGFAQNKSRNPLLQTMANYSVAYNEIKTDQYDIPISEIEVLAVKGNKTFLQCDFAENTSSIRPNNRQIIQNYENVVNRFGGKKVYAERDFATYQLEHNDHMYWMVVEVYDEGQRYSLSVLENKIEKISPRVQEMLSRINSDGKVSVYINFASGKAIIPANASETLKEITELLKLDPSLKLSIEGHTDNQGKPEDNKKLSQERAKSVMDELIYIGVAKDRLKSMGWGEEKPIADNNTEEGKATNRRVELVKQD